MEDLRYPIGKFHSVKRTLDPAERASHIGSIRGHPGRMRVALAGLTDEQLDTPYRSGGWTVRQVAHHVVDSHMNAYVRFKLAATEDRPTIKTYEEALWAELADGRAGPVETSLSILEGLHARWVTFLESLAPAQFERTLCHPQMGDIPMDVLLELYAWHGRHHETHVTSLRERMGW